MGEIFDFSNRKQEKTLHQEDLLVLKSMLNSNIKVKIRILPEELHAMLRVLLKERKEAKILYQEAVNHKDAKEMEYWEIIRNVINSLIQKLKGVNKLEEFLQELSFLELDCLIGTIEDALQNAYLLELQLIENDMPFVTPILEQAYHKIIPIYEEKRVLFEQTYEEKD